MNNPAPASPISLDVSKPPMSDLGQHLFDMCGAMNKARMAELGLTPPATPIVPKLRFRELEVSDEHALYLLMLVADDLLAKRARGQKFDYVALEMQAALNVLVSES